MQKGLECSAGNSNKRIRIIVCLALLALAAGCAATPRQTVPFPVYSDSDCQTALNNGAQAMADCSREHVLAKMENRPANYAKARESLASALAMLKPGKVNPAKPRYERAAVCFEMALTGVDRVITSLKDGDEHAEAIGWEVFDQSASELLLVLGP